MTTLTVSQVITEVGWKDTSPELVLSQLLVEVGWKDASPELLVSQFIVEVGYLIASTGVPRHGVAMGSPMMI